MRICLGVFFGVTIYTYTHYIVEGVTTPSMNAPTTTTSSAENNNVIHTTDTSFAVSQRRRRSEVFGVIERKNHLMTYYLR